jgi:hypothetical protein
MSPIRPETWLATQPATSCVTTLIPLYYIYYI